MKIGHKTNQEELERLGFKDLGGFADCTIYANDEDSLLVDPNYFIVLSYPNKTKDSYENKKT